jgi:hypothetical protein
MSPLLCQLSYTATRERLLRGAQFYPRMDLSVYGEAWLSFTRGFDHETTMAARVSVAVRESAFVEGAS